MKKAIVIGSSSVIGRELSILLSKNGYRVGITGRRENKLEEIQKNKYWCFYCTVFWLQAK